MKRIALFSFFLLAAVLLTSSCGEDFRTTRNLYDNWWPVHAQGSMETEYFTATWNGDLNSHGSIDAVFKSKTNPDLQYTQTISYRALYFQKDRKHFVYITINSMNFVQSKPLLFYVKDKKIYFEKMNEAGRGSGEYEEGKSISFVDEDHLKIEGVTYERYSVYREKNRSYGSEESVRELPLTLCDD